MRAISSVDALVPAASGAAAVGVAAELAGAGVATAAAVAGATAPLLEAAGWVVGAAVCDARGGLHAASTSRSIAIHTPAIRTPFMRARLPSTATAVPIVKSP